MLRDFTYIDDIAEGVIRCIDRVAEPDPAWNSEPVRLMDFIAAIEAACGKEAVKEYLPMQPGDVYQTNADTSALQRDMGYKPSKDIRKGVRETVAWFKSYYHLE